MVGIVPNGLKPYLMPVLRYCQRSKLPWLTVIVVLKGTDKPSPKVPDYWPIDIHSEQAKVQKYDWPSRQPPTVETLRATDD